jgi:hypothetical protein
VRGDKLETGQNRQKIDDGPKTIRVFHEGGRTLTQLVICRYPSQDIVDDENRGCEYLNILEDGIIVPKHQGHNTQNDGAEHEDVINTTPHIVAIILLNNCINISSHHFLLQRYK